MQLFLGREWGRGSKQVLMEKPVKKHEESDVLCESERQTLFMVPRCYSMALLHEA